jgi:type I restriction enzyme M protein
MNMFLHGMDGFRIEWCDTINSPKLVEPILMKFDIVVANPPFSLDKWGIEEAAADPFTASPRHAAEVEGRLRLHHPHDRDRPRRLGRVGVIVPHGVLFRAAAEGRFAKS